MPHEQADEIILLLRSIHSAIGDVVPSRLRIWTRRERAFSAISKLVR